MFTKERILDRFDTAVGYAARARELTSGYEISGQAAFKPEQIFKPLLMTELKYQLTKRQWLKPIVSGIIKATPYK